MSDPNRTLGPGGLAPHRASSGRNHRFARTHIYGVHGLTRSYFTRKVTGYLDYTERAWRLEPTFLDHEKAAAAGWNGGIPVVEDPSGAPMWDSTSIIEHLDTTPR